MTLRDPHPLQYRTAPQTSALSAVNRLVRFSSPGELLKVIIAQLIAFWIIATEIAEWVRRGNGDELLYIGAFWVSAIALFLTLSRLRRLWDYLLLLLLPCVSLVCVSYDAWRWDNSSVYTTSTIQDNVAHFLLGSIPSLIVLSVILSRRRVRTVYGLAENIMRLLALCTLFTICFIILDQIIPLNTIPYYYSSASTDDTHRQLFVAIASLFAFALLLIGFNAVRVRLLHLRVQSLLAHLQCAIELNMPLVPIVDGLAASVFGGWYRRLNLLRAQLLSGQSLDRALELSIPELPSATVRRVGAAIQSGQLSPQLAQINQDAAESSAPGNELTGFYVTYAKIFSVLLMAYFALMAHSSAGERLQTIAQDFRVELPLTARLANPFFQNYYLLGLPIVLLLTMPSRFTGRIFLRLIWYVPVVGRLWRQKAYYELCSFLNGALSSHTPLPRALRLASIAQANPVLRRRVAQWADLLDMGAETTRAGRESRLPSTLTGMLDAQSGPQGIQNATHFLAAYYEGNYRRLRAFWEQASPVMIIILMSLPVTWLALSVIQPMAALIDSASSRIYGGF